MLRNGAPTATVSPDTPTDAPKRSPGAVTALRSAAVSVASAQPVDGRTNTEPPPAPLARPGLPATIVPASSATELAPSSPAAPSLVVSRAVWVASAQPAAGRVKTYAAPVAAARCGAPATTVSASIATALPRASPAAPSEAVSVASGPAASTQPPAGRSHTNAAPWSAAPPSRPGAPATTASPETPTDAPSASPGAGPETVSAAVSWTSAQPA